MKESNAEISVNIYDSYTDKVYPKKLEELVKELVAWSMPLTFHIEALKCQSIIMRTKIVRCMRAFGGSGALGKSEADVNLAHFLGLIPIEEYKEIWKDQYENYKKRLERLVEETKGKIILFNNKPIEPRFHIACGGATENSENVDGNIVQYLRKVLCSYCADAPYHFVEKDFSVDEIERRLGIQFLKENHFRNLPIGEMLYDITRDEENRVTRLKVAGKELRGKEIAELLDLDSTRFGWKPQVIRFFSRGKGDGVGLCQYGADGLANTGKKAEEIIEYYYTGVQVKKIQNPCIKTPLKGKIIVIDPAHGGEESEDNKGKTGLREKDVNLSIALYVAQQLENLGADIHLTRRTDEHISLNSRAELVNKISPHFFISIHQNYFSHPSVSGTEIYHYRGDEEGKQLAREIIKEMTKELKTIERGVKVADFFLLREAKVSALHIEVGYLSNPKEEVNLATEDYQKAAAEAIKNGILNYYRYS